MISFKRGSTIFSYRVFYNGNELVGELISQIVDGIRKWSFNDVLGDTQKEAVLNWLKS